MADAHFLFFLMAYVVMACVVIWPYIVMADAHFLFFLPAPQTEKPFSCCVPSQRPVTYRAMTHTIMAYIHVLRHVFRHMR